MEDDYKNDGVLDEERYKEALIKEDYQVSRAYSGTEALYVLSASKPDLILLDLMLPGLSGEEVLSRIKGIPVIVVSAKIDVDDKVALLLGGATDYITKPFSMDELLARISAHLRREERKGTAENLRFDEELIIDYNSRTVFYSREQLDFSNKEFEIIRFLSQNAGMVFDRETIYEKTLGISWRGR